MSKSMPAPRKHAKEQQRAHPATHFANSMMISPAEMTAVAPQRSEWATRYDSSLDTLLHGQRSPEDPSLASIPPPPSSVVRRPLSVGQLRLSPDGRSPQRAASAYAALPRSDMELPQAPVPLAHELVQRRAQLISSKGRTRTTGRSYPETALRTTAADMAESIA